MHLVKMQMKWVVVVKANQLTKEDDRQVNQSKTRTKALGVKQARTAHLKQRRRRALTFHAGVLVAVTTGVTCEGITGDIARGKGGGGTGGKVSEGRVDLTLGVTARQVKSGSNIALTVAVTIGALVDCCCLGVVF